MPDASAGILTLALGDRKYARQARWLARSIRRVTDGVPLAVATDLDPSLFRGVFDIVIPWRQTRWRGAAAKLELPDITPFETTLFLDSDCLCLRSATAVMDSFAGQDFAVYGTNTPDFHWAGDTVAYRAVVDAESYPVFNGGLYYFTKSALARDVFARAQGFSADYDRLGLPRPRGMFNDELLIGLAMASLGLRATDTADRIVMLAPEPPDYAIDLDILHGRCAFVRRGVTVEPDIVHFVGPRDRIAAYRREGLVLDMILGAGWPRASRPLFGLAVWLQSVWMRATSRFFRAIGRHGPHR